MKNFKALLIATALSITSFTAFSAENSVKTSSFDTLQSMYLLEPMNSLEQKSTEGGFIVDIGLRYAAYWYGYWLWDNLYNKAVYKRCRIEQNVEQC